jgi:hypothetical protein
MTWHLTFVCAMCTLGFMTKSVLLKEQQEQWGLPCPMLENSECV